MPPSFLDIQNDPSTNRLFIVGGGIVGAALAFYLSESQVGKQVIVLDKSLSSLSGSTGYVPGFVGQFNTSSALTALAKDTLATTTAGSENLQERCNLAKEAGLPAEIISAEKAAGLAPDFVKTESISSALHFPSDGTANAGTITRFFRQKAEARGAVFLEASISSLEAVDGSIATISTSQGRLKIGSNPVILCTGIWTQSLLQSASITESPIPIVPVAHPYTYTTSRPSRSGPSYPFVRWPEYHVYARDHGNCDGLGSYNHTPSQVEKLSNSALGTWPADLEKALAEACRTCLKNGDQFITKGGNTTASTGEDNERKPYNGIFSITPDNLPLAGKVGDVRNLWLCAAVWVTHAAGTAKLIAKQILREDDSQEHDDDALLLKAVDPNRFKGGDMPVLTREALEKYNDIYNKQDA